MTAPPAVQRPSWVELIRHRAASDSWAIDGTRPPADGRARASAVLILLADDPAGTGPDVVLLERASTMRRHAGQIAFPGGAADPDDANVTATAVREAQEEIGLDPGSVETIGILSAVYVAPSGYLVSPVLAYWRSPHPIRAVDVAEVAAVHTVALARLAAPEVRFTVRGPSGYVGPAFDVDGLFVWGFTALVLDHVLRLGGWERPWNAARHRPIPSSALPPSAIAP